MFLRLALIHSIFFGNGYISNIIPYHFYFPEAFLQVKKLMEKSYSETEQNMSEKQGKGQIMLHLPMKFENHAMNRENEFIRRLHNLHLSTLFFSVGSSC
jgi:hypothetical protein